MPEALAIKLISNLISDLKTTKMIKYLISWVVVTMQPAECPDWKPDPITGQYPYAHCSAAHYKILTFERDSLVTGDAARDALLEEISRKQDESAWPCGLSTTQVRDITITQAQ